MAIRRPGSTLASLAMPAYRNPRPGPTPGPIYGGTPTPPIGGGYGGQYKQPIQELKSTPVVVPAPMPPLGRGNSNSGARGNPRVAGRPRR